jgi:hypothetical protein
MQFSLDFCLESSVRIKRHNSLLKPSVHRNTIRFFKLILDKESQSVVGLISNQVTAKKFH